MKVKVFLSPFELQAGIYSFIDFKEAIVLGDLTEQVAAQLAHEHGVEIKRTFQSNCDDDGAYIIGLRYKPVAIVVPEGHPKFTAKIFLSEKLRK